MFTKGQIVLDETRKSAVIPAAAVREESGQMYVFTIENGKIARRPVQVGFTEPQQGLVEVRSGLEQGLNVVSARVSGLKAGAPAMVYRKHADLYDLVKELPAETVSTWVFSESPEATLGVLSIQKR